MTFLGYVSSGSLTENKAPASTQDTYSLRAGNFMLCGEPTNYTGLPTELGCHRRIIFNMDREWSLCCISACPMFRRQTDEGFCCICEGARFSGNVKFLFFYGNICVKYSQDETLKYSMCGKAFSIEYTGDCP